MSGKQSKLSKVSSLLITIAATVTFSVIVFTGLSTYIEMPEFKTTQELRLKLEDLTKRVITLEDKAK